MNQQRQSQQPPQQPAQAQAQAQQGNNSSGALGNPGVMPQQQFPMAAGLQSHHQPMQPQHLMGLMSNPALAAAASSHPLFPPSAMLSNPGAFLAMQPEAFGVTAAAHGMGGTTQQQSLQPPNPFADAASAAASVSAQTSLTLPPVASKSSNVKTIGSSSSAQQHQPVASHAQAQQNAELAKRNAELTPAERAKQNRDRNREHARSTRLRKKAYVQKLKELVEGLHAERAEEVRARRVAVQHLAEKQQVRRGVVRSFLQFHSEYETDERKWKTILEEDFWLKQPVTPYRSFRRAEIEKECRVSRGIDAMISDSASFAVMMESIGSRSPRWLGIKREEFTALEQTKRSPAKQMPRCIERQESRLQHAISSLSSSSDDSNNESSSDAARSKTHGNKKSKVVASLPGMARPLIAPPIINDKKMSATTVAVPSKSAEATAAAAAKVSSSSGSGSGSGSDSGQAKQSNTTTITSSNNNNCSNNEKQPDASKDYHDYHAKPLPDPKLSYEQSGNESSPSEDSPAEDCNGDGKRAISGDSSSSGDEAPPASKRRKADGTANGHASPTNPDDAKPEAKASPLPPNIAKKGGISHNIRPQGVVAGNGAARLRAAPAVMLPPFAGIGKKCSTASVTSRATSEVGSIKSDTAVAAKRHAAKDGGVPKVASVIVQADNMDLESEDSTPHITGSYHINEDDMILMDDFLMCPFVFRSSDAVVCGACSECVMPGMLRATFSSRNKLASMELVYDAMGFMQQLERASGNEGTAQIIAGSLEMALDPLSNEARVITLAKAPFLIVNVNEMWTRITGYTQMEVEGEEYLPLLQGEGTVPEAMERPGKPVHKLEEVAKGRPACSTNIHYDSSGRDFIEFVSSYPLTNVNDEITHILHVSKELPSFIQ